MGHLSSLFEGQITQVYNVVHAMIKEVISRSVASWRPLQKMNASPAPKRSFLSYIALLLSPLTLPLELMALLVPLGPPVYLEILVHPLIHILIASWYSSSAFNVYVPI